MFDFFFDCAILDSGANMTTNNTASNFAADIATAENVHDLLSTIENLSNRDLRDMFAGGGFDGLPVFGGEPVEGASVFSYDANYLLVCNVRDAGDFAIIAREQLGGWLLAEKVKL